MHIQAVSTSGANRPEFHHGVNHSAGHPDHGIGGGIDGAPSPGSPETSRTTPWGSPGTAEGGPTVPGVAVVGSFGFGV